MANQVDPNTVPTFALSNGDKIPCIGMGTFGSDHVPPEEVADAVAGAIRCGYRLFDCASVYGNEPQIGKVFDAAFREGIVKREDLFIMSKVWNDQHGKGEVRILPDRKSFPSGARQIARRCGGYRASHCSGDCEST
jgi:alcohol dehydrogenase (NADP+)